MSPRRANLAIVKDEPMPKADSPDAAEALRNYDETFLECRDLRHTWKVVKYYNDGGAVSRRLQCQRCPMQRIDTWYRNGQRASQRYEAPDDYGIKGVHVSAYDIRVEVLNRAKIYASEGSKKVETNVTKLRANGRKKR